ncbi:MAG: hypothetical protein GY913_03510 [Proteobacteria bacterium]|nr:hypothetical protein [Pseudomonadota bacterium]MCP4915968.1 hypothetical protein [Pseudomonadota bacterium]
MLVRELVLKNPRSIPVLRHYGIDYCCGGDIDFDEACAIQEVDPKRVLADIVAAPPAPEHDWAHQPLDKLIDHIQARYHDPLYGDLEEIIALGQKVARAHADDHGEQLEAIVASLQALQKDLLPHLKKEEDIVFPWIRGGGGPWIPKPLEVEMREHEEAGRRLRHIRSLCDDYDVPQHACPSWSALWARVEELEKHMHEHIHLENNILFPRSLAGE